MDDGILEFEEDMRDPFEQIMARRNPARQKPQDEDDDRESASPSPRYFPAPERGSYRHRGFVPQSPRNQASARDHSWRERKERWPVREDEFRGAPRGRGRSRGRGPGRGRGGYPSRQPFLPQESRRRSLSPYHLVDQLIACPNFRGSLLRLLEEEGLQPDSVREAVLAHSHAFCLEGEDVVLRPKVALCTSHSGPKGCQNRSACEDLHICPMFVSNQCNDRNCFLGHNWKTDHNGRILQKYYLDNTRFGLLRKLIQSSSTAKGPVGKLDICDAYNNGGCTKTSCSALHICHKFITGFAQCPHGGCKLNHNLQTPECSHLLMSHGFSINESARDIVGALHAAYPALSRTHIGRSASPQAKGNASSGNSSSAASAKSHKSKKKKDISSSDDDDSSDSDSDSSDKKSVKDKRKAMERNRKPKSKAHSSSEVKAAPSPNTSRQQTVWTYHLYGDTSVNELCYYSVESSCRYESSGCRRLHSIRHYHWQVSEQGSKWLNLRPAQVKCLELSYCKPEEVAVSLPRLDPAELDSSTKQLLSLLGRDTWKANFEAMVVTNSNQSKVLPLRRLCTESTAGHAIKENTYDWYFLDKRKKWVMYGKVDTVGEVNLVSSVTSDDIEKHYLQTQAAPLSFRNASFTYTLNFTTMTQTNQQTQVHRQVRRRPRPHILEKARPSSAPSSSTGSDSSSDLPATWEPMQPQERLRLVDIPSTSSEYQAVLALTGGQAIQPPQNPFAPNRNMLQQYPSAPSRNGVQKIQRVQNPFLWRAFQNKVREMTTVYGDVQKVNVRQVFHGTGHNVVASICAENFDWRLHGTSAGQAHGRGTYFSPNFSTSCGYCKPDPSGLRYIFVAKVAVGFITRGNSSTVRPPLNPATNVPFDSTGDGTNVIVKYDKQEYYPEYVIIMR